MFTHVLLIKYTHLLLYSLEGGLQMDKGLDTEGPSNLLMIPTMVDTLPDGHEEGEFFGIDFGGSILRVLYTKLSSRRHEVEKVRYEDIEIPDAWKSEETSAAELFDNVADCLINFVEREGWSLHHVECPTIGFAFNFPVEATSLSSGTLLKWVKGFKNPGAVGHDPTRLLADAFKRKGINVNISALLNNTVAALAGARYVEGSDARISIVNGTGTNACYVELLSHIGKYHCHGRPRTSDMVINLELAGCSAHCAHVPLLPEDMQLDEASVHRGQQQFEKLTAGLYLGDLSRRIILTLAEKGGWWEVTEAMQSKKILSTRAVLHAAGDSSSDLREVAEVLAMAFGLRKSDLTPDIRTQVRKVCKYVVERSARLEAAALAGIIIHLQSEEPSAEGALPPMTIVAVEGEIFRNSAAYVALVVRGLRDVLGPEAADHFALRVVEGGAAFGAACVAAAGFAYQSVMGTVSDHKPNIVFPRRSATSTQVPGSSRNGASSGSTEASPRAQQQEPERAGVRPEGEARTGAVDQQGAGAPAAVPAVPQKLRHGSPAPGFEYSRRSIDALEADRLTKRRPEP
eukprot:jgi/Botrbrau1/10617/Bobra.154_1s0007.2